MKKRFLIILVALLWCNVGFADYYVTGKITGWKESFMGFKVTETNVDAVKGKDGRIYSLQQSYKKVDEYDSSKRRCWIYTKSRNSIGKLIDLFTASTFYEKNTDGSYTKIKNLSSITFPCDKR